MFNATRKQMKEIKRRVRLGGELLQYRYLLGEIADVLDSLDHPGNRDTDEQCHERDRRSALASHLRKLLDNMEE